MNCDNLQYRYMICNYININMYSFPKKHEENLVVTLILRAWYIK